MTKFPVRKGLYSPLNTAIHKAAFLRVNSEVYESLVKKVQKMDIRIEGEAVLSQVAFVAQFATLFHPGRFADGAIENLALDIGRMLGDLSQAEAIELPVDHNEKRRRILHVASKVQGIGGLERMLYHWIRNDQSSCHSLVVLNQEDIPIPQWLSEAVQKRGGNLLVFPQRASRCQKAQMLRETARRYADLVVLHHYSDDPVPTVAFAVRECPPVAIVNHNDHEFWVGSSVADLVINLRTISVKYTEERRFMSSNIVLPIPLIDPVKKMSRQSARRILGIPEDQVVLISIGRAEKYKPRGQYDFVETGGKILDRQPAAHLYIVGESQAGIAPHLRCEVHDRLHFVGIKEDPSLYHAAADVYLESFPFGTQTSLLEAALGELPVVPAYAPLFSLLVANDDALQDILSNPDDEQEYIELVESLIKEPEKRVMQGKKLRERLLTDHVEKGWLNRLVAIYQETDCLIHNPRSIPTTQCRTTVEDIALSTWHVVTDNKTKNISRGDDPALLWHIAYLSEYSGDYIKAGWFTFRAMRLDPRGSWRIFAKMRSSVTMFIRRHLLHRRNSQGN